MALVVDDIGTVITLNLEDVDDYGDFSGEVQFNKDVDTVNLVFRYSDQSTLVRAATFETGSQIKYTTIEGDLKMPGRLELQAEITSAVWSGRSAPYVTEILRKY